MAERPVCYTIGHSSQPQEMFLRLLADRTIGFLADVRSSPYSRFAPQFNGDVLRGALKACGVTYVPMGGELGARHNDPSLLFPDGRVDFSKVRETAAFRSGIDRIMAGVRQGRTIALMCSEKEPFECHRFCLIAPALAARGVGVQHILEDGSAIANEELEERLLRKYRPGYNQINLFEPEKTRADHLRECYAEHNRLIAYRKEEENRV